MADSLIYEICKDLGNLLLKKACLLHRVPEEANKMEQNLRKIKAVLKDAEQREIDPIVKIWLSDLKNVAYDIENVLDDCRNAELQMGDESGTSQQGPNFKAKVPSPVISSPYIWSKQLKSRRDIAHRIKSINERLGEIDERKNRFNFLTSNNRINEGPKLEATSAYGDFTTVRSQEEVKAKVIKKLVHGDSEGNAANANHIPIISLVGMGGIGKTTLARLVYNDEIVKSHFPKTIWVCVSNTFNEMNVARAVAGDLGLEVRNDSTLHLVLSKIEGSIRGLKFLLVLDDVWGDSEGKWSSILNCLGKGDTQGRRILMTTRNADLSKKMGADIVSVEELCAEDAWLLFCYYAFPRVSVHRGIVKYIAEELARKCHGLPLALEVLGRHMATKTTRREWDDVLTSELWKTQFEERVFNSLAFSYLELPSEAKRCFAFCSIFPKDTVMMKNNLIRLWMAQGYLQGRKADQMEVLGEECFESLVRRSFLRVTKEYTEEFADTAVTMHDIVHDFAHYISNGEVAILDPPLEIHEGGVVSKKLRHLAICGEISESNCPHSTSDFNALRTLFLSTDSAAVLKAVCSDISYIRALDIRIYLNSETPPDDYDLKNIGKLVHLRYLCLGSNNWTVLPKEICGLPYLQTLDVSRCTAFKTLPNEIGRLTSLRHLLFNIENEPGSFPKGLGKLSSLQTLSCFFCSRLTNEDCSNIGELRDLNNLRGELRLRMLNHVANVDEAARAELHMKTQIRELHLEFGDGDASLQSEVLEALQPAEGSIEFLGIWGHRGRRCPRWIGMMRYLKEVLLEDVSMESLPEMGRLCFLEKLSIWNAWEVKHVGAEFFGMVEPDEGFFPKLTDLEFEYMSQWEHWEGPNVITKSGVAIMPSLRYLRAMDCKALRTLPRFLEHVPLEIFEVDSDRLPLVELAAVDYPNRWRFGDILLPNTMKHIDTPFLKLRGDMAVVQPKEASEVAPAVQHQQLNFTSLHIDGCRIPRQIMDVTYLRVIELMIIEDESLPPFGSLPFLQVLTIFHANKVEMVGDEFLGIYSNNTNDGDHSRGGAESTAASIVVFPRLKKLSFQFMLAWREWEDPVHGGNINLAIMPSLCHLEIYCCDNLKSLPHFFDSVPLQKLDVGAYEMLRIRNASSVDEATTCKTVRTYVKASAATLPPQQPDFREITLHHVKNDWVLDWAKYCRGLRNLTLFDCGVPSLAALELLPSLGRLEINSCYGIRHIGKELLQMSSIRYLKLSYMLDSEEWEDPPPPQLEISDESREPSRHGNNNSSAIIKFMPGLCSLSICGCPKLKALPSFLRSVPLTELVIEECPGLATWWINEAGEDWRSWKSTIPKFSFVELKRAGEGGA